MTKLSHLITGFMIGNVKTFSLNCFSTLEAHSGNLAAIVRKFTGDRTEKKKLAAELKMLEDAETGIAAGALAALLKYSIIVGQGLFLQKPSKINVSYENENSIWVGGTIYK